MVILMKDEDGDELMKDGADDDEDWRREESGVDGAADGDELQLWN